VASKAVSSDELTCGNQPVVLGLGSMYSAPFAKKPNQMANLEYPECQPNSDTAGCLEVISNGTPVSGCSKCPGGRRQNDAGKRASVLLDTDHDMKRG
jgi:hypothetical protein